MSGPGEKRRPHFASWDAQQVHHLHLESALESALEAVRGRDGRDRAPLSSLTVADLGRTYHASATDSESATEGAAGTSAIDAETGPRAERLARVWSSKVSQLSSEDVLIALLQGWGLALLVPQVLDILARDPLASGGWFRGDYVRALMQIPATFWSRHPRLYARYRGALRESALRRRTLPTDERSEFWTDFDLVLR